MDTQQFGKFIADQRKAKGYTQKELADKLQVTDKAISRWENGHGYPDISFLEPLATELGVTVLELMHGKTVDNDVISSNDVDEALVNAIDITVTERKSERKKTTVIFIVSLLLVIGIAFIRNVSVFGIAAMIIAFIYALAGIGLMIRFLISKKRRAFDARFFYSILLIFAALGMLFLLLGSSVSVVH